MEKQERVSETIIMGTLLALTGGYLDAYSYMVRGGVFANAETGNIVLMGIRLAQGEFGKAFYYLVPIVAFAVGVFAAEWIRLRVGENSRLHWKEGILWAECALVFLAGLIPQAGNFVVNTTIAFVCAMQVEAFRKIRGKAFATTMCTGNLRSGTELLSLARFERDTKKKWDGLHYYWIDLVFAAGAVFGTVFARIFRERAVWFCCITLLAAILYIRNGKKNAKV